MENIISKWMNLAEDNQYYLLPSSKSTWPHTAVLRKFGCKEWTLDFTCVAMNNIASRVDWGTWWTLPSPANPQICGTTSSFCLASSFLTITHHETHSLPGEQPATRRRRLGSGSKQFSDNLHHWTEFVFSTGCRSVGINYAGFFLHVCIKTWVSLRLNVIPVHILSQYIWPFFVL